MESKISFKNIAKKLVSFSMASWISAFISFISTPIITRIFIPNELGKINLFITFMMFCQTICILGLDQGYMRFYNEENGKLNKKNLLSYCMKLNFIVAIILSIIILLFNGNISSIISNSDGNITGILLIVVMFSSNILRMNSIDARVKNKFWSYSIQTVAVSIIEKLLLVLAIFIKPVFLNAALIITFGYLFIALIILFRNRGNIFVDTKDISFDDSKFLLKFSIPYLPVLLLSLLNSSIPQFFLKHFCNYADIGIFSSAVTIANILGIVQTGFSVYWSPFVYENYKTEKVMLQKVHKAITFLIIILACCVLLGQDIIFLLLGENFRSSKLFFSFLLFIPICNTIADTTGIGIMLSKKSYLNIITFFCNTLVNIILCLILIPKIGVAGAAIAAGTSAIVMLVIRTILGNRYYKITDKFYYIVISIVSIYVLGLINLCFDKNLLIRYSTIILCFIINLIVYKNEVKNIFNYIKNFFVKE